MTIFASDFKYVFCNILDLQYTCTSQHFSTGYTLIPTQTRYCK